MPHSEKTGLYTIYDEGAEEFGPTFQAKNEIIAKRMFKHALKDSPFLSEFTLVKYADYELTVDEDGDFDVKITKDIRIVSFDLEVLEGGIKDETV